MKTVYVAGTFDLLHVGHVRLFKRASKIGRVVVAVNPDDFCRRYKRLPVIPLHERVEMVAACRDVDRVIVNWAGEDSKPAILSVMPDYIMHGDDWDEPGFLEIMGIDEGFLAENSIELLRVPYTPGVSTTGIRKRIYPNWLKRSHESRSL